MNDSVVHPAASVLTHLLREALSLGKARMDRVLWTLHINAYMSVVTHCTEKSSGTKFSLGIKSGLSLISERCLGRRGKNK